MTVEITSAALAAIRAHAASSRDEVCGLLLGDPARIAAARPCANVHAVPARFFELDPAALIAAYRTARAGGPQVLGHYHSHPSGIARPSVRDASDAAADGAVWIVIAADALTAWRAVRGGALHDAFDPVALVACAA